MRFSKVLFKKYFLLALILFQCLSYAHSELRFSSSNKQTQLIELYTSEGCSSCPPADRWLSSLKASPQLWNTIIPISFHVDYWDDIGWPDQFANPGFSKRQRQHAKEKNISQVYTPGFVVNGNEWRGWYRGQQAIPFGSSKPGVLDVRIEGGHFVANFNTHNKSLQATTLTVAILANGLSTEVNAGENKGEKLEHDFVVLALESYKNTGNYQWQGQLPAFDNTLKAGELAVAVWVNKPFSLKPVQATGGLLNRQ